jgi:hypothetical protein
MKPNRRSNNPDPAQQVSHAAVTASKWDAGLECLGRVARMNEEHGQRRRGMVLRSLAARRQIQAAALLRVPKMEERPGRGERQGGGRWGRTHGKGHAAQDRRGLDRGAGVARDQPREGEGDGVARRRTAGGGGDGDVQHGQAVRGREDDAVRDGGGSGRRIGGVGRRGGGRGGAEGFLRAGRGAGVSGCDGSSCRRESIPVARAVVETHLVGVGAKISVDVESGVRIRLGGLVRRGGGRRRGGGVDSRRWVRLENSGYDQIDSV